MSVVLYLLLAAGVPVDQGRLPIRAACDEAADIVADVGRDNSVRVISSMTLDAVCYLVEAGGVRGYLVGGGHPATEAFDRERRQGARELGAPPRPKPVPAAAAPAPQSLRPKFPEFSGVDVQGTSFNLASIKGPVTLIYFWSPSNAASRKELEVVDRIYQRHFRRGLSAIGVSVSADPEPVRQLLNDVSISFPQYPDRCGIAKQVGVASVPRMFVLNASHEIVESGRASELQNAVNTLMRPPAAAKP